METPSLCHLSREDYEHVYEPAEDTFLLLDAIESDIDRIRQINPTFCLEVGAGSGCVITAVAKALAGSAFCLATDINPKACRATRSTSLCNHVYHIDALRTDLVSGLDLRLQNSVDLLIFNPPYVITESSEVGGQSLSAAWAGGVMGREVIDRFLPHVPKLLSKKGLFYLIVLKENGLDTIEEMMAKHDLTMSIVLSRRCGSEHLLALRFCWK